MRGFFVVPGIVAAVSDRRIFGMRAAGARLGVAGFVFLRDERAIPGSAKLCAGQRPPLQTLAPGINLLQKLRKKVSTMLLPIATVGEVLAISPRV